MIRIALLASTLAFSLAGAAAGFEHSEVSVTRDAAGELTIRWPTARVVDVLVSEDPAAAPAVMRLISNDDADGEHALKAGPDERLYFLLRNEATGETVRLAERLVPLEGGSNFRDLGGYPAAGGKRVRWGRIFRTGAMPRLTEADEKAIAELGVRSLVDLRSVDERQLSPTDWRAIGVDSYFAADYPASELFGDGTSPRPNLYELWPTSLKAQYRRIFEDLLANKGPALFNCSAGQDRTGLGAALVLSALGVPREVILADYHLSTTYRRAENEIADADLAALAPTNDFARFMLQYRPAGGGPAKPQPLFDESGQARLMASFHRIERDYGSVERYLDAELGVDAADLARLRALYLE